MILGPFVPPGLSPECAVAWCETCGYRVCGGHHSIQVDGIYFRHTDIYFLWEFEED